VLLLLLGTFLILMLLGMPISFALGLAAVTYVALTQADQFPLPWEILGQTMVSGVDGFELLVVPFFILVGDLMSRAKLTERLVAFATALVGHIRGGLAQVAVLVNLVMAGMSGSAIADASAVGTVMLPSMEKSGYPPRFSAAVVAAGSTIGPIFPPSAPMAIIGALLGVSVGRLFIGGIIPGLLIAAALMLFVYVVARRRNFSRATTFKFASVTSTLPAALPAFLLPAFLIGAVAGGWTTITEASVVGVWYALLIGFIARTLRWREIGTSLVEVGLLTATILFVVAASNTLGVLAGLEQFGPKLLRLLTSISTDPVVILLLVNVLLLILGIAIEPLPLTLVMLPLLFPVVITVGIDPVHFGVVMTLNLMLAMLTPPVAMLCFITASIAKTPVSGVFRESLPFFWVLVGVLLAITLLPSLVLWLPDLLLGPP
jgi:tripartite ATP-independent transporter DctM subunit